MLTAILALGSLVTSALANPLPLSTRADDPWSVTSYSSGCSPGGCAYGFNVTNPTTTGTTGPLFNTYCSGVEHVLNTTGAGIPIACENKAVTSSQTYDAKARNITVEIQFGFGTGNAQYMATASHTYRVDGAKPVAFALAPTIVSTHL